MLIKMMAHQRMILHSTKATIRLMMKMSNRRNQPTILSRIIKMMRTIMITRKIMKNSIFR